MEQELPRSTTISASKTVSETAADVTRTIREAIKLTFNNKNLMLRVLVCLYLIPLFLLVLIHSLVAGRLLQKVEDSYENSSWDQKDLTALLAIEVLFLGSFSIVWLLGTALTISAASSAYHGKSPSLKDLMLWTKSKFRKIFNTGLHVALLVVVFLVLFLLSVHLTALMGKNGAGLAFTWLIRGVAALVYLYLALICVLSLVVTVLEDDCHGALALKEALVLLKERKLQACLLILILTLLSTPICILFYIISTDDDDEIPFLTGCPFMLVATVLFCLANFFTFLVFTLFYLECKLQKSHGEKIEMQLEPEYCLVPVN